MSGDCSKVSLFFDDFSSGVLPGVPASPYAFFTSGNFVGNDAAGGVTASRNNLQINSVPFIKTEPNGLDHVKYLVYTKEPFQAPGYKRVCEECISQELVYDAVVSAQQSIPATIPYPYAFAGVNNAKSDIRLCSSALNVIDLDTFIVFDFFLSDEDVYAFYERLPFGKTVTNNYHAFSHAIPVAKRKNVNSLSDFIKLSIAYNKEDNYVRWLVNDLEVFRVERIGYPLERKYRILDHGGVAELVRPQSLFTGFGTFSLLNMYNPQNPGQLPNASLLDLRTLPGDEIDPIVTTQQGLPVPPTYIVSPYNVSSALFGQGSTLNLKYVHVYKQLSNDMPYPDNYKCKEKVRLSRATLNAISGVNALEAVTTEVLCRKDKY